MNEHNTDKRPEVLSYRKNGDSVMCMLYGMLDLLQICIVSASSESSEHAYSGELIVGRTEDGRWLARL